MSLHLTQFRLTTRTTTQPPRKSKKTMSHPTELVYGTANLVKKRVTPKQTKFVASSNPKDSLCNSFIHTMTLPSLLVKERWEGK